MKSLVNFNTGLLLYIAFWIIKGESFIGGFSLGLIGIIIMVTELMKAINIKLNCKTTKRKANKKLLYQQIRFALKMMTGVGIICGIFGTVFIVLGGIKDNPIPMFFGISLILYAGAIFTVNWNHDNICGKLEKLEQEIIKSKGKKE